MTTHEAIVVGAGPAGSSLALRLARVGRQVALIDGRTFPRAKVCGEGLMPAGVAELEALGVLSGIEAQGHRFTGIRYRLPDGTAAEAEFPDGATALGFQREVLDTALLRAVEAEPTATVRLGTWARDVDLTPAQPRSVRVGDEVLTAPVLIAADGCRSPIRRAAGLDAPPPRRERFGLRGHFEHPPTEPRVEVFVADGHELYTTPAGPDVTCAAMLVESETLTTIQGDLERALRDALAAAGGRCAPLATAPLRGKVEAIGPLGLQATAAHADGLLLVGDAAGALDPITGEGIALALTTCAIAAEVLDTCFLRGRFAAVDLSRWTYERRQHVRAVSTLTSLVLHLSNNRRRAQRAIKNLAKAPQTFERLLGVASGLRPATSLKLRDGLALALGV